MENCKIIDVSTEDIPKEYYNRSYAYFSFSVMNGKTTALHLVDITNEPNEFLVIDVRGLTPTGREKFREFLRSIIVTDEYHLNLDLDLAHARKKYGITVKRRQRKESK